MRERCGKGKGEGVQGRGGRMIPGKAEGRVSGEGWGEKVVPGGIVSPAAQGQLRAFTKQAHYTNITYNKHNLKVSPFGIALIKKWQQS